MRRGQCCACHCTCAFGLNLPAWLAKKSPAHVRFCKITRWPPMSPSGLKESEVIPHFGWPRSILELSYHEKVGTRDMYWSGIGSKTRKNTKARLYNEGLRDIPVSRNRILAVAQLQKPAKGLNSSAFWLEAHVLLFKRSLSLDQWRWEAGWSFRPSERVAMHASPNGELDSGLSVEAIRIVALPEGMNFQLFLGWTILVVNVKFGYIFLGHREMLRPTELTPWLSPWGLIKRSDYGWGIETGTWASQVVRNKCCPSTVWMLISIETTGACQYCQLVTLLMLFDGTVAHL